MAAESVVFGPQCSCWAPISWVLIVSVWELQYWKSNANYWCDLCKVWMTDKQSTRATHEAGIKHQELVQKSAHT